MDHGNEITAVILAGGKGTRLRPFTMNIPKPLLPVGEVAILEVVVRQLVEANITRIVLALGHMGHLFSAVFGNGSHLGASIEYCYEQQPCGTAGALRLVKTLSEDFLVMNGDLLTTIDYQALVAAHKSGNACGTIAMHRNQIHVDYGVVVPSEDGLLSEYREKPVIHYDVSMGINVLSRESLQFIPAEGKYDMPELMLTMRRAGKRVICHRVDCYWKDIGRLDDYQQASEDFVQNPSRFVRRKW